MEVFEKLWAVQNRLKVPKNQVNKFGGYNYRSCEDILEAVKPILQDVGATLTVGDELIQMGDRYYVKATASFADIDTGNYIQNTAYAREAETMKGMTESQITGTASSYARKYALNGLFCLDDVKDDDATSTKSKSDKLETKYVNSLRSELKRTGVSEKSMLESYKAKSIASLEFDQYQDAMTKLEKKPDIIPAGYVKPEEFVAADEKDLPWNQ